MPIEIAAMGAEHVEQIRSFTSQTWPDRLRDNDFFRWRYAECPALAGYLALKDGLAVGMAAAFERPYRIGSESVAVRECFDWFCLPRLRNSGVGVRLLKRLMDDPEPIVMVGGTDDTRTLLPKLGFREGGRLASYTLPLGSGRVSEILRRRAGVPPAATRLAMRLVSPLLAPRPRQRPSDGIAWPVSGIGAEALALYTRARQAVVPLWRLEHLRWLTCGFPGIGSFVGLYFARGAELVGWSLVRVFTAPAGRQAQIVDLFAPEPDADLFTWMVSETSCVAAGFRPDVVNALTTSAELGEALRRNGYRSGVSLPVHLWDRQRERLPEPLFLGGQWGDFPIWPFPQRWWTAGDSAAS
jgi:acetyltransferase (GNAT) family protein